MDAEWKQSNWNNAISILHHKPMINIHYMRYFANCRDCNQLRILLFYCLHMIYTRAQDNGYLGSNRSNNHIFGIFSILYYICLFLCYIRIHSNSIQFIGHPLFGLNPVFVQFWRESSWNENARNCYNQEQYELFEHKKLKAQSYRWIDGSITPCERKNRMWHQFT